MSGLFSLSFFDVVFKSLKGCWLTTLRTSLAQSCSRSQARPGCTLAASTQVRFSSGQKQPKNSKRGKNKRRGWGKGLLNQPATSRQPPRLLPQCAAVTWKLSGGLSLQAQVRSVKLHRIVVCHCDSLGRLQSSSGDSSRFRFGQACTTKSLKPASSTALDTTALHPERWMVCKVSARP